MSEWDFMCISGNFIFEQWYIMVRQKKSVGLFFFVTQIFAIQPRFLLRINPRPARPFQVED